MLVLAETLGVKINAMPWEGAGRVPYMLVESYDFRKVTLDGMPCVFAEPRGDVPPIQTLLRHIEHIREVEPLPAVLKLNGLSGERRKALIEAKIPFVATEQIYLPFLGVALREKLYAEPKPREKLMPSTQLVLFSYLYQDAGKMYTSGLADKLGVSAMQITRAVRQLQRLNLFEVSKEGVQIVIRGKTNHRALFESADSYLLDPVREIIYVPRNERTQGLPYAGLNALSELSVLSAPLVTTLAYYNRTDKLDGENSLTDREKQVRIEVWKYSPTVLSGNTNAADPLSVIVSLRDERDERVAQAIEEILTKISARVSCLYR
jgi:DNA-binding MarR family transcriptional regulator